jgi:16S rRNA U516 pseudouridylate synthase RsuA-like enzyme
MLKSVNSKVVKLKRLQIGSMKLGNLPIGMWRILKPNEIASLKNIAKKGRK